jgi:hypothetical protein
VLAQADDQETEADTPYFTELMEQEDCDFLEDDSDVEREKQLALARCDYVIARVTAEASKIEHSKRIYDLQYSATVVSTILVHIALVVGLVLSTMEFRLAMRLRSISNKPGDEGTPRQQELSVSMEGIAVKTTLVGFLILASSLAFYFLYLKTVYPII